MLTNKPKYDIMKALTRHLNAKHWLVSLKLHGNGLYTHLKVYTLTNMVSL